MRRFSHDFPAFQLVVLTKNYEDGYFDCRSLSGGESTHVWSIEPGAAQVWKVDFVVVMGHNDRNKNDKYLRGPVMGVRPTPPVVVVLVWGAFLVDSRRSLASPYTLPATFTTLMVMANA